MGVLFCFLPVHEWVSVTLARCNRKETDFIMFFFCLVLHLRSHDSQLTWFRTCPVVLSSTPFFLFFSPLRFKKRGGEAAYCTMYSTVSERKKSRIEKWCDECHRCGSYIVACCLVATLFFSFSFSLAFTALK